MLVLEQGVKRAIRVGLGRRRREARYGNEQERDRHNHTSACHTFLRKRNSPIFPTTGDRAATKFDSNMNMAKEFGTQFAALPFQIAPGGLRVLLITSRETRCWIIPKGWPIRGLKPRDVAAREAFEEAGLVGRIAGKRSIGSYHYSNQEMLCRVKVFLLSVGHQVDDWPEKAQREWCWVEPARAAQMVEEGGLAEIIRGAFPFIRRLEPPYASAGVCRGDRTGRLICRRYRLISNPAVQDSVTAKVFYGPRPSFL
jgi:8-oxo-dGTP pyrophosphatase MutT (NUDIX family)